MSIEDRTSFGQSFEVDGDRLVRCLSIGGAEFRSEIRTKGRIGTDLLGAWWRAYLRGERPRALGVTQLRLRVAELFCGSGGMALGLDQACAELGTPWQSAVAVDQDRDALGVYARRNSTRLPLSESVSGLVDDLPRGVGEECRFAYPPEIVDSRLESFVGGIDLVLAGPPCQGHSNLNNHSRRTDRRNDLYLKVPAIAVAMGASTVVIENVASVIHDSRQVVQSSIALLESSGYQVEVGLIKAAGMGWPQSRERYFVVASRLGRPLSLETVVNALASAPRPAGWAFRYPPRKKATFMDALPELSEENRQRVDFLFDNDLYDLPDHVRPECHQNGTTYTAVYGRMHPDRPAPTITTGFLTPGRGRFVHPTERRVLTPREAARLQGFPDTYDFRRPDGMAPSKSQLVKWIGDAVPMPLGYAATLAALAPAVAATGQTLETDLADAG